jgi:autotransporter translocation and assembly factor TamB
MRKFAKIAVGILGGLVLVMLVLWLLVQTKTIQNRLVRIATDKASAITGTTIKIGSVDFSLFNRFYLNEILIRDKQKDTLLYAGALKLKITDWFFFKDDVTIQYLGLENALIQTNRKDSIWNYQFLLKNLSSGNKPPKGGAAKSPRLELLKLEINDIRYISRDMWRGEDQLLRIDHLALTAKEIDLDQKKILIEKAIVEKPNFQIRQYKGFRPDSLRPKTPPRIKGQLYWNPEQWNIAANSIVLKNGLFASDLSNGRDPFPYFDGAHMLFSDIHGTIQGLKFMDDTLKGVIALSTKERSGFEVTSLKARMKMDPDRMSFSDLMILTPHSRVGNQFSMEYRYFTDDMAAFISNVNMKGNIQNSTINLKDIAYFAPALNNSNLKINISGNVNGTVQQFKANNISLAYGNKTNLTGNLMISGLPDTRKTNYQLDRAMIKTDAEDLYTLIPVLKEKLKINLKNAGSIFFSGNAYADHDIFSTQGVLSTSIGKISSNIQLNNIYEKNIKLSIEGKLLDFNAGKLLDIKGLEKTNGEFNIKGNTDGLLSFGAQIKDLTFNDYIFKNILSRGRLNNGLLETSVDIDDENLIAALSASIDLRGKQPKSLAKAEVYASDLRSIKFTALPLEFTGKALIDITGDNPDNINGSVRFDDITIFKEGQPYVFDSLYFSSFQSDDTRKISLTGKEINAQLSGTFEFAEMAATFNQYFSSYYPMYFKKIPPPKSDQEIEFHLDLKNTAGLFRIFNDELSGFSYSRIDGKIDTKSKSFILDADIPKLSYNKLSAYDFAIRARGSGDSLRITSKTSSIVFNDSLFFPNNEISIYSSKDVSSVDINTFSEQSQYGAKLSGTVLNLKDGIKIHFNPSSLVFNEKTWMIDQDGEVVISKSFFDAKNFRIANGEQSIGLITLPAEAMRPQTIIMSLTKVNLGEILPFVLKEPSIQGITSGDLTIEDPFNKAKLYLNAQTEKTRFEDDSIGLTSINAFWDNEQKRASFNFDSENPNYQLDINGKLNLKDSIERNIETNINLKNVSLSILKPYLGIVFSDINGYGNGVLQLTGNLNSPDVIGKVNISDAKVTIGYTQCTYILADPTIEFNPGRINFGEIRLKDIFGNTATLKGDLEHRFFRDFRYNISASARKLQVLNTQRSDNDLFYGKTIGRFNFSMTGPEEEMRMKIVGAPVDSSVINILTTTSSKQKADVDYIVWKNYGTEVRKKKAESSENLIIDLDLSATPLLRMNVILDELTGDVISGQGNGNLKIHTGTKETLSMNGRYNIESGSYNFNFQDIFKKPFKLLGGGSSYISWNGDPFDAEINIQALYLAEKVRMSTLFTDPGNGAVSGISSDLLREISDVEVRCNLTGTLSKPNPAFQIVIPQNSTVRNNSTIDSKLKTINRDPLEVSKQSTYLIVFKSFAPQAAVVASDLNSELINTTISGVINGILSNSIQNLFSKMLGSSVDVNFNYSRTMTSMGAQGTGNTSQNNFRENVSLQFIKTLLDDKLIITFGSDFNFAAAGGNALATTQSFLFLPDVNVEYKITPDGKFRTSFFYRSSFDLLSASGKRDRTGGNISFRTEFDTMFGKRKKNILKKEE